MTRDSRLPETGIVPRRGWRSIGDSAVLTSWFSIAVRTGGLTILTPLVLAKLPPQDVTVWLLFSSILMVLLLADFGLSPTFVRAIAYTQAAAPGAEQETGVEPDAGSIENVVHAMRYAYVRLTYLVLLLAATVGTACLIRPISQMEDPVTGWVAWAVVVAGGAATVRNIMYSSILQGVDQIALLRRWEAVVNLAWIAGSAAALMFGLGLLGVVVVSQAGSIVAAWINRRLSMVYTPASAWTRKLDAGGKLPTQIWSSAWRSGIGVMMTIGVTQGSGIVYAQLAPPVQVASFLFAQRIMHIIGSVSQVPFYTRIPALARLYAENKSQQILSLSRTGMGLVNWLFVISVVCGWLVLPPLLNYIGSSTLPPTDTLWWAMAGALVLHRVGAMYLQTYSITNHIVWHVADGISSLIILIASFPLYSMFGAIGLPLAWIAGYLLFYVPYSVYTSVSRFPPDSLVREFICNALPIIIVAAIFMYFLAAGVADGGLP